MAEGACRTSAGLAGWLLGLGTYYNDTRETPEGSAAAEADFFRPLWGGWKGEAPNQQPSPNSVVLSLGTRTPGAWSAEADVGGSSLGPVGGMRNRTGDWEWEWGGGEPGLSSAFRVGIISHGWCRE